MSRSVELDTGNSSESHGKMRFITDVTDDSTLEAILSVIVDALQSNEEVTFTIVGVPTTFPIIQLSPVVAMIELDTDLKSFRVEL